MAGREKLVQGLAEFLDQSPTAWHATANLSAMLLKGGYQELKEEESWSLKAGGKYFVSRGGASLAAFHLPSKKPLSAVILGSHTDSPALKLKPNAEYREGNLIMVGVEVYGGVLLNSWLNRDLGLAGKILVSNSKGEVSEHLVRIDSNPLVVPQLAIHLDRSVNDKGLLLDKQKHLPAILGLVNEDDEGPSLVKLLKQHVKFHQLLSYDLFLYPLEKASFLGQNRELLASGRLDNLASAHASAEAMLGSTKPNTDAIKMAFFWDHEEIGSETAQGAGSPFLSEVLERVCMGLHLSREEQLCLKRRSLCLSIDMAHALHPNYKEMHEPRHQPLLGQGVVLKSNAQQRYATDASSGAWIVRICQKEGLNLQRFVIRTDLQCGSTVGPICASHTGIPTADIGIPQLSMHSTRELMACQDHLDLLHLLKAALG